MNDNGFMRTVHIISLVLTIIGALNWGLVGLFQFDLVAAMFGGQDAVGSRAVYALVGLAGLGLLMTSMSYLTNRQPDRLHSAHR